MLNGILRSATAAKNTDVRLVKAFLPSPVSVPGVPEGSPDTRTNSGRKNLLKLYQVAVNSWGGDADRSRNTPATVPMSIAPSSDVAANPLGAIGTGAGHDPIVHRSLKQLLLLLPLIWTIRTFVTRDTDECIPLVDPDACVKRAAIFLKDTGKGSLIPILPSASPGVELCESE